MTPEHAAKIDKLHADLCAADRAIKLADTDEARDAAYEHYAECSKALRDARASK